MLPYNFLPWISQILFFLALIPQIRLNYKLKSTTGLSDYLLVGYFYAYTFYLFYVFCMDLSVAYKTMIPLSSFAAFILIIQSFYYSNKNKYKLKIFYFLNFLFFIILIFFLLII